ncbi:tRNA lysidine(34) synthetase TilS [Pseudooctadecabacter sp.]|uniref:tRNA lysidine(34) synthetase TilS n=1 Tax=Pseudooctadecabacter sp. TaxID=1966338 RepID=UPI0035C7C6FB
MLVHFVNTAFVGGVPDTLGVAVSGGGDSMALLLATKHWADLAGTSVQAVTVDHGLRPEAADEAQMVAAYCAGQNIPHTILKWDGAAARGNVAAAGRQARYLMMADWAKARGIDAILLGHTVDDVAETFVMRLARKSGVDGLALMDTQFERHDIRWARPFWQQNRADLRGFLRRHDVPWVEDPTNEDDSYERPRVRKALATLADLGIDHDTLKAVAINMAGARGALEHYTAEAARTVVRHDAGDVIIDMMPRPPIPPEVQRRLLVGALMYLGGGVHPPRADAMLDLDVGLMQAGKHTLAGCVIVQKDHQLRVCRELQAVKDHAVPVGDIWDRRWQILGAAADGLTVRALGEAISQVPDWRDTGLPRASLMVSPAVFRGDWLVAAPIAGLQNGFEARIVADFALFLESR